MVEASLQSVCDGRVVASQPASSSSIDASDIDENHLVVELIAFKGAWVSRRVGSDEGSEVFFIRKSSLRDVRQWSKLSVGVRVSLTIRRASGRGIVADGFIAS